MSFRRSGFTLLQVMLAMGIMGAIVIGVMALSRLAQQSTTSTLTTFQAENFRRRMVAVLQNDLSWKNTVADVNNASLACLRPPGADCRGQGGDIIVHDASDNVLHDPTAPNNGVSRIGEPCNTFSMAGNKDCPFRFDIRWAAVCPPTGTCSVPQVKIDGVLFYRPETQNDLALGALNEKAYEFHLVRGQDSGDYGNGTRGLVAKWISQVKLGNSIVKETAGKLGIGVGAADARNALDVKGGVALGVYAASSAAPANGLIVPGDAGVGRLPAGAKLDVNGLARIGPEGAACDAGLAGAIRFQANKFEGCQKKGTSLGWCPLDGCPCDPDWSDVVLMLHCDGAEGGQSFPDSSPINHPTTILKNPYTTSTGAKPGFGQACTFHDSGDHSTGDHTHSDEIDIGDPAINLGTGDFTVEFFVRPMNVDNNDRDEVVSGQMRFRFKNGNFETDAENNRGCYDARITGGFTNGVWYHLVIERKAGQMHTYRNGQWMKTDPTCTYNYTNAIRGLGSKGDHSDFFWGQVDEFRVTKKSRYAADHAGPTKPPFPVPTRPYDGCD